jgi:hypothetical protein
MAHMDVSSAHFLMFSHVSSFLISRLLVCCLADSAALEALWVRLNSVLAERAYTSIASLDSWAVSCCVSMCFWMNGNRLQIDQSQNRGMRFAFLFQVRAGARESFIVFQPPSLSPIVPLSSAIKCLLSSLVILFAILKSSHVAANFSQPYVPQRVCLEPRASTYPIGTSGQTWVEYVQNVCSGWIVQ